MKEDEKLLTGTEAEKLLPPENYFPLNAKEFLTRTPMHELKNVFGAPTHEENQKQETVPAPLQNNLQKPQNILNHLPPLSVKQSRTFEIPKLVQKEKPRHGILKFFGRLLLFTTIIIIALYIWGGILVL